jgi:hypothetical protein
LREAAKLNNQLVLEASVSTHSTEGGFVVPGLPWPIRVMAVFSGVRLGRPCRDFLDISRTVYPALPCWAICGHPFGIFGIEWHRVEVPNGTSEVSPARECWGQTHNKQFPVVPKERPTLAIPKANEMFYPARALDSVL